MQAPLTDNIDVAQTAKEPAVLLLEARSLQCVKNDTVLFEDLDIALCGGEILQIDGANGSGKTSLIRILCGLAEADEGEVTWCGYNIQSYRSEYLQDLVYVAHANGIKTDLTLMENLVVVRALCAKTSKRSLEEVLALVELSEHADLPAANLSSGQRRRLALARLLIADVRLFVLDEPFNSLDETSKKMMSDIIVKHVDGGGSVILTTHERIDWRAHKVKNIEL